MSERKRSFQFGLRKLLLWTAVVALYLGIFKMLAPILDGWVVLLALIIILAIIRAATNAVTTAILSVVAAGILFLHGFFDTSGLYVVLHPGTLLLAFGGSFYCGVLLFAVVELPFRAVNWVDSLMRTKSDEETRRD